MRVVLLLAAVLGTGCDVLGPSVCPADLRWSVSPREADLTVGESVIARAEALGCGGTERLEEEMRWTSTDPTVATVNEVTGRITARGAGNARVIGEDLGPYRIGPVEVPVTVSP